MLKTTFLRNAHTRFPFEGVAGLYRALQRGPTGSDHNPIFYVSSSPWNLYDLLAEFLDIQGIPQGPLFLRDFGIERRKFIAIPSAVHKGRQIERILAAYPHMRFILIGDSGQEDPEIYRDVVKRHGDRVLAIYIRDVSSMMRDARVNAIAEEVRKLGVDMVLVRDSEGAAEHALQRGFIEPHAIVDVRAEKAKDHRTGRPTASRIS
jgi:phosphatidate phosphatase APP1